MILLIKTCIVIVINGLKASLREVFKKKKV